jgi:hypothetical protein
MSKYFASWAFGRAESSARSHRLHMLSLGAILLTCPATFAAAQQPIHTPHCSGRFSCPALPFLHAWSALEGERVRGRPELRKLRNGNVEISNDSQRPVLPGSARS